MSTAEPKGKGERRIERRWQVGALRATVPRGEQVAEYAVENVSASGALLTRGPLLPVGETFVLSLWLRAAPIGRVRASVVRHARTARGKVMGVVFDRIAADCEDALQEVAIAEVEYLRTPAVLVVTSGGGVHDSLVRTIEALGRRTLAARTPLDAMAMLVRDQAVTAVVVDLDLETASGLELMSAIAEMAPAVRRVLVSARSRPQQLALAMQSGFVDDVLCAPPSTDELRRALAAEERGAT